MLLAKLIKNSKVRVQLNAKIQHLSKIIKLKKHQSNSLLRQYSNLILCYLFLIVDVADGY